MSEEFLKKMLGDIKKKPSTPIKIDLKDQEISLEDGSSETFEINSFKKMCLLKGYDDIDFLLSKMDKIKEFEKQHVEF